ncbi:ribose 5-phosphate isomerase B [Geomicrobium sp. JCM 19037]|nr:ribose 5-phosphate isomerase B [Geomicrobium sp. JCM 19037]
MMKVIIGSDHAGLALKKEIVPLLEEMGIEYEDVGAHETESVDYPDFARPVSEAVAAGTYDRGILICGTGIGMSISANKVKNIRCALVHDVFSAEMTRRHNDTNVLAMGERVIGPGLAKAIVTTWLETEYEGGRHQRRVEKMMELD